MKLRIVFLRREWRVQELGAAKGRENRKFLTFLFLEFGQNGLVEIVRRIQLNNFSFGGFYFFLQNFVTNYQNCFAM